MRLFTRLLWLGPLVVFLAVCIALGVAWAFERAFGIVYDVSAVCAIGAVAGGLVVSGYIWQARARVAAR